MASRLLWMSANRANFIRSRILAARASLFRCGLETVADAAHGRNPDAARLQLLAQAVHVHLDRIAADFLAPSAQVLDKLVLVHETSRALQKELEQVQLACGQL